MSDDRLFEDGQAWEALERMAGHDPEALLYPPDIAERIEAWSEESGLEPIFKAIVERIAQTGEDVEYDIQDGRFVYRFVPHTDDDDEPA